MSKNIRRAGSVFMVCAVIFVLVMLMPDKASAAGSISASFDNKTGILTYSTSSDLYYGFMVSYPGGKKFTPYGGGIPGETSMSYSFADLFKESGTYSFQVFAVNKGETFMIFGDTVYNAVAQSNVITVNWTKPGAKIATPTNLRWSQDRSQIVFEWDKVSNCRRYVIHLYEAGISKKTLMTSSTSWSFLVSDFTAGKEYYVTITAETADISSYCDSDSATSEPIKVDANGNPTVNGKPIPGSAGYKQEEFPTEITINRKSATLYYGQTLNLTATVAPSDAKNKTVTWSSTDTQIATVSNGVVKVTGAQAGKTNIIARTANDLTAQCEITVYADNNSSNIFADIKYNTWQYSSAKSVYDKAFMTGKGKLGKRVIFSPNTNNTRSQFVVSLYAMDGQPKVTYHQQFSDVESGAWYAKAITWASDRGIVSGNPNGTFGVNGKVTREQLALMFYQYAAYKHYDISVKSTTNLNGFTDASKVDSWALTAMKWAVQRGIISGKGNATEGYRLDPTKGATRIECAAMINKFDEIYSGAPKTVEEDLEEPIALPVEEIEEDALVPDEEIENPEDEDNKPGEEIEDSEDEDNEPGEEIVDSEDEDNKPGEEIEDSEDEDNEPGEEIVDSEDEDNKPEEEIEDSEDGDI